MKHKAPNRSAAVMQQRHEARDALDDFPTPMWATRALLRFLKEQGQDLDSMVVREPAANRGYMAIPLSEEFDTVLPSDVHDYGVGYPVEDYLFGPDQEATCWTITNPPFVLAQQFIERARRLSNRGVAIFVRSAFLEGIARYETLFSVDPPKYCLQFVERVVIYAGRVRRNGERYYDPKADNGPDKPKGKWKKAASATSFCFLIWDEEPPQPGRPILTVHVPPCRLDLERPDDYRTMGEVEPEAMPDE